MQYFQQEAAHINKTIRISKGALSCFVMSDYSGNLPHLHAEIKQACAHAFRSYLDQEALFVSVDYGPHAERLRQWELYALHPVPQ